MFQSFFYIPLYLKLNMPNFELIISPIKFSPFVLFITCE